MKAKVYINLSIVCFIICLTLIACSQGTKAPPTVSPSQTEVEATTVPTERPTEKPPTPSPVPPTTTPAPPTPTEKPFPDRNYPEVIIANFEASPRTWIPKMNFQRDVGINTIIIHLAYLRDSGEVYELVYPYPADGPTSEEYVRELIITARAEGFAVMLGPMVGRLGDPHVPIEQIYDWERFKSDSIEIIVK